MKFRLQEKDWRKIVELLRTLDDLEAKELSIQLEMQLLGKLKRKKEYEKTISTESKESE